MDFDSDDEDWSTVWNDADEMAPSTSKEVEATPQPSNSEVKIVTNLELNDNKAGMVGLDREKINKVILEASKGSRYYDNEQKKQQQILQRIEQQKMKVKLISDRQLKEGILQADLLLNQLESNRELSRTIVHVDMDAFFAAVEMRDRPELMERPMAVGSSSMLSTSNYAARRFGVRAAMPGFIAKKLCPELVIVPLNFQKYQEVSQQVKSIISLYDQNFSTMSLDEAYLDITDHLNQREQLSIEERTFILPKNDSYCDCDEETINTQCLKCSKPIYSETDPPKRYFGVNASDAVEEMRFRIYLKTSLTASAGLAPNTMLAKICSDRNKPNGQFELRPCRTTIMEFMENLPIRKVSGIGKVTENLLSAVNVKKCSDLYKQRGLLYHLFSQISFSYFMRIYLGIGATKVESDSSRKSLSVERTFGTIDSPEAMMEKCEELCQLLSEDLKTENLAGKTVTIKLKTIDFEVKTRALTMNEFTMDFDQIFKTASNLLKTELKLSSSLKLRLMGVRMSNFSNSQRGQSTITGLFSKQRDTGNHPKKSEENLESVENEVEYEEKGSDTKKKDVSSTDDEIYDADTDVDYSAVKTEDRTEIIIGGRQEPTPCISNQEIRNEVQDELDLNEVNEYICPVCSKQVHYSNLDDFNRHIDICLSSNNKKPKPKDRQMTLNASFSLGSSRNLENENAEVIPQPQSDFVESSIHSDENSHNDRLKCPVCGNVQVIDDLVLFNRHIDSCLLRKKKRKMSQKKGKTKKVKK